MSKLKHFQFLSGFDLDKDSGHNIVELKELQYLYKRLCISSLDNIVCEADTLGANIISGRKYLKKQEDIYMLVLILLQFIKLIANLVFA